MSVMKTKWMAFISWFSLSEVKGELTLHTSWSSHLCCTTSVLILVYSGFPCWTDFKKRKKKKKSETNRGTEGHTGCPSSPLHIHLAGETVNKVESENSSGAPHTLNDIIEFPAKKCYPKSTSHWLLTPADKIKSHHVLKTPHVSHGRATRVHTRGGNYALPPKQHTYRVVDKWTQISTGRYTEGYSHTHMLWVSAETSRRSGILVTPSRGRLKGSKTIPHLRPLPVFLFFLSSLLLSSLWPPSRQPITLMALFSTLSTPPPPFFFFFSPLPPSHHFLLQCG